MQKLVFVLSEVNGKIPSRKIPSSFQALDSTIKDFFQKHWTVKSQN